eukprot:NODE_119_length_2057_cov_1119.186753_g92_i0.p1 GENE.NODE_119_length_2057_cov_1119.186753_g92_i0~~NODE_119_length_2057_cov_1119.186753_g92_i0.p1  ORF type:complete len:610 (+),score=212.76 NODE_119_length_2057_cov_1119.186753_g92_i0:92-1921(+)
MGNQRTVSAFAMRAVLQRSPVKCWRLPARTLTTIQKASRRAPTIGLFVPADPRLDAPSIERACNISRMTANVLKRIKLPNNDTLGIVVADIPVKGEADADIVAEQFKQAGVEAIVMVPDTWFYPGKTAIAVTSQFPRSTPIALVAGNNAPKPGVVGVDATIGAYSQTGILCPCVIGNMPEVGMNPEFDDKTKDEIVDLVWAMAAVTWLRGRRVLSVDTDSMQMETALNSVHAARKHFGIESVRDSMKIFADMMNKDTGYDKKELEELYHWATEVQWKGRIFAGTDKICSEKRDILTNPQKHMPSPPLSAALQKELKEELKLYLILRGWLQAHNCIGGAWTNQLGWGSDNRGIPMVCPDIGESLFNSTFDHLGKKPAMPFATENDFQALLTMTCFSALTGGAPVMFADYRKVYEPWEIQRKADELGIKLDPNAEYMKLGCVDMDNSGSGSLDWAGGSSFLMEVYRFYFPGGGFSVSMLSPGGIDCLAGRLAYNDLTGVYSMVSSEARSQELPGPIAEAFAHASSYAWPHTWLTFKNIPASISKYAVPANHIHFVQNLPIRRWQHFSDFTNVLNAEWEVGPKFTEGIDRVQPMLYRTYGGETLAKLRLGGR